MTMRAIRMRVHAGRLEPLEELTLSEGSEVIAMVPFPDLADKAQPRLALPKWNLGVREPLTRREIYEDVG
jgi:hypothetical protein